MNIKVTIPYVEFYITNQCNLSCNGCNRFNNFHSFVGDFKFDDYAEEYKTFAKKLDLPHIKILGGEPLVNPYLEDWIIKLNETWPKSNIGFVTNGLLIQNLSLSLKDTIKQFKTHVEVSVHHEKYRERLNNYWAWHNSVSFNKEDQFSDATLIKLENNRYKVHNSDPQPAFKQCSLKSPHFFKGKLYKCGAMAILPEFIKTHDVDLDEKLLQSYKPLNSTDNSIAFLKFIEEGAIPQCTFCPEEYKLHNPL